MLLSQRRALRNIGTAINKKNLQILAIMQMLFRKDF